MSSVEAKRKLYEPCCMVEAYSALFEPCCALKGSQQAIVDEEIMADITNAANVNSHGSRDNERELPMRTIKIKLHNHNGSSVCNSPRTVMLANGSTESQVGASAIELYNQTPGSNTKENATQISHNLNSSASTCIRDKAIQIHNSITVGWRRARAKNLRSVFVNPKELRACDNVVLECVGVPGLTSEPMPIRIRRTDLWKDYPDLSTSDETVVVAIEATHISPLDVCIRHGLFADEVKTPFVLGSNFVGIVHYGALPEGIRVAALTKTGSNARYIATTADALVKVPKRFDASEIACVISAYLPALQALHNGRQRHHKYTKDSLKDKKILLTDGGSMVEIHAMVQLAFAAGAASVHVACHNRYNDYVRTHLKAKPLSLDMDEWLPKHLDEMDVVIDYDYTLHRHDVDEALAPRGRLVWFVHPSKEQPGLMSTFQNLLDQAAICAMEGGSVYNVYDNWEFSREESQVSSLIHWQCCYPDALYHLMLTTLILHRPQEDLKYLFTLLASRKIRPNIDRFITLGGIRQAHDDMQTRGVIGSIICEPWKET